MTISHGYPPYVDAPALVLVTAVVGCGVCWARCLTGAAHDKIARFCAPPHGDLWLYLDTSSVLSGGVSADTCYNKGSTFWPVYS